jgi:hypothetical protein
MGGGPKVLDHMPSPYDGTTLAARGCDDEAAAA